MSLSVYVDKICLGMLCVMHAKNKRNEKVNIVDLTITTYFPRHKINVHLIMIVVSFLNNILVWCNFLCILYRSTLVP